MARMRPALAPAASAAENFRSSPPRRYGATQGADAGHGVLDDRRDPAMNITAGSTALTAPAATADELVIENLTQLSAEEFQPGTCICWTQSADG